MHSDNEFVNLRDVIETLCYMVDEDSDGVEEVMQLPSIDIVRCGECKHRKPSGYVGSVKIYECDITGFRMHDLTNHFCSYGCRKESDNDSI